MTKEENEILENIIISKFNTNDERIELLSTYIRSRNLLTVMTDDGEKRILDWMIDKNQDFYIDFIIGIALLAENRGLKISVITDHSIKIMHSIVKNMNVNESFNDVLEISDFTPSLLLIIILQIKIIL